MNDPHSHFSPTPHPKMGGFTLLELSIVLVIIALLIAGIFAGTTLIQSSRIRSTIAQKERFDIAATVFRTRYLYLPGDVPNATKFGGVTRAGSFGRGNGDGMIDGRLEGTAYFFARFGICAETLLFWRDMIDDRELNDFQSQAADSAAMSATCVPAGTTAEKGMNQYLPISPWGPRFPWMLNRFSNGSSSTESTDPKRHYYDLIKVSAITTDGYPTPCSDGIYADVAYIIDAKADDGLPTTGKIRASSCFDGGNYSRITDATADCVSGGNYKVTNGGFCSLRFDVGF